MEEFVRCYIGNIHLKLIQNIQQQSGKFHEWTLISGSEFTLRDSYGYVEGISKQYELILNAIAQNSVIAETKSPREVRQSILWHNALNIADVLTLLSIARVKYYSTHAVEKSFGDKYSISWGLIPEDDPGIRDIIPIDDLGKFISETMDSISRNPQYLQDNGFNPSIYWYNQALISRFIAPSVLEMGLYWICIEILAGVFNETNRLGISNKKEMVYKFVSAKGYTGQYWDYLKEMIDDWYIVRNGCFHEGKQSLTVPVLTKRRQQVRDFISLVLLEMLQKQDAKRVKEIADRIRAYE